MLRNGFLRFCDDPEIACCRAEAELGQLREENAQLRTELAELQELAKAKAEGRLVVLPVKVGDTVWWINTVNELCQGIALEFHYDAGGLWCFVMTQKKSEWIPASKIRITREEAEKAIGGGTNEL